MGFAPTHSVTNSKLPSYPIKNTHSPTTQFSHMFIPHYKAHHNGPSLGRPTSNSPPNHKSIWNCYQPTNSLQASPYFSKNHTKFHKISNLPFQNSCYHSFLSPQDKATTRSSHPQRKEEHPTLFTYPITHPIYIIKPSKVTTSHATNMSHEDFAIVFSNILLHKASPLPTKKLHALTTQLLFDHTTTPPNASPLYPTKNAPPSEVVLKSPHLQHTCGMYTILRTHNVALETPH